ncbi:MAG: hypothetical protein F6J87_07985 [Spirulina sp. SIO3F2]|nr:hypothetical protein [Spirulina sp. SIO3F2]
MPNQLKSPIQVRILEEGQEAINVWPTDKGYQLVVKNPNGQLQLFSIELDEYGMPRLKQTPDLVIAHKQPNGGNEIVSEVETTQGKVTVSQF